MTGSAASEHVLDWSNELLAARSLGAFAAALARGPALPGETLAGSLILLDPRQELRLLLAGEAGDVVGTTGLRFVDGLASLAPALTALHAPWSGAYHAADHGLLFGDGLELSDLVLLPLPRGLALEGVYAVGARGAPPGFAGLGAAWVRHVGEQALATAERMFQRARLLRAGVVDPLTGWSSRHYFMVRLREQVALVARRKEPACCVVIDLDGLGALNETHGVGAGDALLREAGMRIEALVRGSDVFAHLGDDEFAVLLPATTAERSRPLLERVLAAMCAAPADAGATTLPLRVSIGVAVLDPETLPANVERKAVADHWLADAQTALHSVKRAGGDGYAFSSAGAASAAGR